MTLQEKLEAEASERAAAIASEFVPHRCASCNTAGVNNLASTTFLWRKQVSRSQHDWTRVEHRTELELCPTCFSLLQRRRLLWRFFRTVYGFVLGGAFCGVIGTGAVLFFMRLNPQEHRQAMGFLILSIILCPMALFLSFYERTLSVPLPLLRFTGKGWECWKVGKKSDAPAMAKK